MKIEDIDIQANKMYPMGHSFRSAELQKECYHAYREGAIWAREQILARLEELSPKVLIEGDYVKFDEIDLE